ncbi:MlaD family protein [Undibacterium terreum]|uniref:Mammalian cell entry protein n=1 Tax=Undibacterium terreum TaxID=1224302 RepID=A0A916V146_9BURK|nr:MlaD family protein [Undibacterium terreum]GGD01631.1 mammalian cell entry protein [Undibacterium terreum]
MENRSHALIAGFFTIGLVVATILIAVWFGRDKIQRVPYEIATKMSVAGLNLQAAVRYKGIKVGNVTNLKFSNDTPGLIVIRIEVAPDTPITQSTFATLSYQGVTGIAFVQLDDDGSYPVAVAAKGQELPRIPLKPGLMQNLEQRGTAIMVQVEELTRRLNTMLDPEKQKTIASAIDNINQAAIKWQQLPEKLEPTLAKLPAVADQAQHTLNSFKVLSDNASTLSNNLNGLVTTIQGPDGPIVKLTQSVDQISNGLSYDTLPKVTAFTTDARTTFRNINRAVDKINDRPQSLLFGSPPVVPGPGEPGFAAPKQ